MAILVDGGERAVIWDRFSGVKDEVVGEGTHFLILGVQKPHIFDVRTKPRSLQTVTGSKGSHFRGKCILSDLYILVLLCLFRYANGEYYGTSSI